jgi:hypothetical protein
MGVYLTHGPSGARPQAEWAEGLASQPNTLVGQLGFKAVRPKTWLPRVYTMRRSPSRWRLIHSAGRPCGLAARPPPGTKSTSPSQWSCPMTGFLGSSLLECGSSARILWIWTKGPSSSTLGEVGVPSCRDHSTSIPWISVIYL